MGRSPSCDGNGLKKGPWTPEEDQILIDHIKEYGLGNWRALPKHAGLNRCGKSCRLRWNNYLRPDIIRGNFSEDEERIIINLHKALGNKWSKIASQLPGRTDNEIKNHWNTNMRKKLLQMGIDPVTHQPRSDMNQLVNLSQWLYAAQLGSLMSSPWQNSMKVQPDAAQLAKIQLFQNLMQVINANSLPNMPAPSTQLSGLLASQNPNPFDGLLSGHILSQNLYNNETLNPTAPQSLSHSLNPILYANNSHDPSSSWSCLESGFGKERQTLSSDHLRNSYEIQAHETPLPPLVSASPEETCTGKKIAQNTSIPGDCSAKSSTSSAGFDAWEKLLDDESSEAYWKEVLDLASSLPSPF